MELDLDLDDTLAIVTGAGGQIGQVIVKAFLRAGCRVGALDIDESKFNIQDDRLLWLKVDVTDEEQVQSAWQKIEKYFSRCPTVCICAAGLDLSFVTQHKSAVDLPVDQFRRTLDVNVTGTFITAKSWLKGITATAERDRKEQLSSQTIADQQLRNVSLIIIGSEAGVWGVSGNPDYAASKSAVQYGLTLSLAPDAAKIFPDARVNAICPGCVDTPMYRRECEADPQGILMWVESEATVPLRRPVGIDHIARACLMLASDRWSGSTTGQAIQIDCGKSGRLFWHKSRLNLPL